MKRPSFILAVLLLLASPTALYAQTVGDKATGQLGTDKLNVFNGRYVSDQNKAIFLQITAVDGHLVLKQSWDGQEVSFDQKGDLDFYNDERSFPLKFTKSSTGAITQVLAFDRDVWIKGDDNYQFVPQKTIQLTAAQLKTLEGKYQMKDGDNFLQITTTTDHIILKQLWDEKEITFSPVSEVDFVNADQTFPLKFTKGSDGLAMQVLAFNKDMWVKVK
ncbi:hypothetical protein ACPPVU_09230 [Mucilaginibacter sp. McL0603]|uniref:hypothetical protein n=1 Tax=Mucilaginibacter sp. McL0603 TaxID=3415670 RepID=UPI003CF48903